MEIHVLICQQTWNKYPLVNSITTMWNAAVIGGLINVWGGMSCKRHCSFRENKTAEEGNKPKHDSLSRLLLPLIKCHTSPYLEEEEGTCQSCWRPRVALTAGAEKMLLNLVCGQEAPCSAWDSPEIQSWQTLVLGLVWGMSDLKYASRDTTQHLIFCVRWDYYLRRD